jgi:hypothetical protein
MRCDSWASLLARTLASPCLGCNPKARVATIEMVETKLDFNKVDFFFIITRIEMVEPRCQIN